MPIIELKYLFKIFSKHYWNRFIFFLSIFYSLIFTFINIFFRKWTLRSNLICIQYTEFSHGEGSTSITVEILFSAEGQHKPSVLLEVLPSLMSVPYQVANFTKDERSSPPIHPYLSWVTLMCSKLAGFTILREMERSYCWGTLLDLRSYQVVPTLLWDDKAVFSCIEDY